jgi:hypothetical protein
MGELTSRLSHSTICAKIEQHWDVQDNSFVVVMVGAMLGLAIEVVSRRAWENRAIYHGDVVAKDVDDLQAFPF